MAMLADAQRQLAAQTGDVDVLIVDQFEELFTQSPPDEREALFAWLTGLPAFDHSHTHVVVTLRSDYLKELFDAKPVWDLAMANRVELRAMTVDELKDAIQRPLLALAAQNSDVRGKRFEPALLDRLAQDASASPTLLPLLQVTLEELWKKGRLTLASYGTLTDAIKDRADQVLAFRDYDAASPGQPRSEAEQRAVLDTFLDLVSVTLDEDPRQARVSRDVEAWSVERRRLADDLTRARLLSVTTAGEVETISIIHESLIANWQRLKDAVALERERLQQRTRFEAALRAWEAEGRVDDYLLTGIWLAQARELALHGDIALQSAPAKAFLRQSEHLEVAGRDRELAQAQALAQAEAQRASEQAQANVRLRRRNVLLAAVAALAVGLAALAGLFANSARQNERAAQASESTAVAARQLADENARIARSQALAAQTLANQDRSLDLSFLLGVEVNTLTTTFESRSALLSALQHSPRLMWFGHAHTGDVSSVTFSPDGKILASGSADSTVILWDVSQPGAPKPISVPRKARTAGVTSVAFSPDGKTLASGSLDGTVILWDVSQPIAPTPIGQPLTAHTSSVLSVAFSSDGKTLASGSRDHTVILWDVSQPAAPKPIGAPLTAHAAEVLSVAFSPDGKTLASGSLDNTIILWDVSQPNAPKPIGAPLTAHTEAVTSVAFSPDGKTLASGSADNAIILWDIDPNSWIRRACHIAGRNMTRAEWQRYMGGEPYHKTCEEWPGE
jgi:hypothetical protein